MNKEKFAGELVRFLKTINPEAGTKDDVGHKDNLFNIGLIESFKLPQVISFLEEHYNKEIPLEDVTIENFYSIDSIYAILN